MVLSRTLLKAVRESIARGGRDLKKKCARGKWRGFPTFAGESDVWVTAFVRTHTASGSLGAGVVGEVTAFLLSSRAGNGGWSYGSEVPTDADSTAWCLLALRGRRALSARDRSASLDLLWSHRRGGGVATFGDEEAIRRYIAAPPEASVAGWCQPHSDVTAAAVCATEDASHRGLAQQALGWLAHRQEGSGVFGAYWWRGPHYTTALTLRALAGQRLRLPRSASEHILSALRREQLTDGGFGLGSSAASDPFTTALGLESLCRLAYIGGAREREAAAALLTETQQAGGEWPGDYIMRIPAPSVVEPRHVSPWARGGKGGNAYVFDRDGLFATAVSGFALARFVELDTKPAGSTKAAWRVLPVTWDEPTGGRVAKAVTVV